MRRALAFTLLSLVAACAMSQPEPRHSADVTLRELEAARLELARDERALAGSRADGQTVDCAQATRLGENVCVLAERICLLVARLPPDPQRTADCTDARQRCQAARERVQARCKK
jgi:hypothetical protein